MAVKKKIKSELNGKEKKSKEFFSLSAEKKKKILGVFLLVFSIFMLLSIISYNRFDKGVLSYKFSDLLYIFGGGAESDFPGTYNWMGILGAYLGDFSINSLIGVFSFVIPIIIGMWGYSLLQKVNFKLLLHTSNFLFATGIIFSSLFGIFRNKLGLFKDTYELSGSAGNFLGSVLSNFLGSGGAIIVLIAFLAAALVISFDIKIEKILEWIKNLFIASKNKFNQKLEEADKEVVSDNVRKIKDVSNKKKKGEEKDEEETPETQITIIRTDDQPAKTEIKPDKKKKKEPVKPLVVENENSSIVDPTELAVEQIPDDAELKIKKVDEAIEEALAKREQEAALPNPWEENINYNKPPIDLLNPPPPENIKVAEEELSRNAERLKEKLSLFDIQIDKIDVTPGPVVTLYEIVPAPGVKISKIVSLENDIALALAARGIRIIAPIPGKSAIGVEIPNAEPSMVVARQVIEKIGKAKSELPLALGKTISGDVCITDLTKMPHLLIAGSTGSGKSVGINMIITSLLYSKLPSEVKFAIIDPKKIELSFYNELRQHYLTISPDLDEDIVTSPQNAILLLKSVVNEMEKRYDKLAKAGSRNILDYNEKISDVSRRPKDTDEIKHHFLPYIVVIIDELADLMITSGKEVEESITRLAQLARAVGIHLVIATQRPSVNVITGVIKANFPARIAYQVASKIDSRTILDMNGAEQLLGRGDMLFLPSGSPKPLRIQNAFISTDEVERVTGHIAQQEGFSKPYYLPSAIERKSQGGGGFLQEVDELFEDAANIVVSTQQASVSFLQRKLKLGYTRAARIVDQLEEAGIVGPNDGAKARTVLVENFEQLETILRNL